ncbi:hypothetical protein [Planomonospora sphaerica]|uniref:hypothetical protein n=2 Tax=Planomonospora TaxID=1998 RepID=UPI0012903E6E|nr:hypothetical protein [Planomonospora sphaerica]
MPDLAFGADRGQALGLLNVGAGLGRDVVQVALAAYPPGLFAHGQLQRAQGPQGPGDACSGDQGQAGEFGAAGRRGR